MEEDKQKSQKVSVSAWMTLFTFFFILISFIVIGRTLYLQYIWEPDPRALKMNDFKLQDEKHVIKPQRGNILDCNGRLLAITIPRYRVDLDCAVRKEYYATDPQMQKPDKEHPEKKKGEVREEDWRKYAKEFAKGIAQIFPDGRSAQELEKEIIRLRTAEAPKNGKNFSRTLKIADGIDYSTLMKIRELPLANDPQHVGGIIVNTRYEREYPYGELARRVLGYVRNNDEGVKAKGIEGSLNYELHGTDGIEWRKIVDGRKPVLDTDSSAVKVKNGHDVKLTLDINLQDIADRAVRKYIEDDENIQDACMIVMEVKTGAIKAMVNLHKGKNGKFDETLNLALTRATCPGSVFKTVGLMTELEDRKVNLETRLNLKRLQEDLPKPFNRTDKYLTQYKDRTHNSTISVREGLEISSNNVFISLALDNYRNNPKEFIGRLYDYGFGTDWDFDISGMTKAVIPNPDSPSWTYSDLGSVAYGYSVEVTPLHTLAFYNAIANGGNLVKPHIVEEILENGEVIKKAKTVSLNSSICRKATADTLKRALRCVVTNGTGSALRKAKCSVAGKTGTSRMVIPQADRSPRDPFTHKDGRSRLYQGSFAGFFPAEEPVYSAIVVVYTGYTATPYYGGSRPAKALNEVINELYAMDSRWQAVVDKKESMPSAGKVAAVVDKNHPDIVPNLKGMGLNDALYVIENNGYQCRFSGVGHVKSQSPAAGASLRKGETINITLE